MGQPQGREWRRLDTKACTNTGEEGCVCVHGMCAIVQVELVQPQHTSAACKSASWETIELFLRGGRGGARRHRYGGGLAALAP